MAQQQSKLPSDWQLQKTAIAFLQMLEGRVPSDTSSIDTGTITLPELAARVDQLIQDLKAR